MTVTRRPARGAIKLSAEQRLADRRRDHANRDALQGAWTQAVLIPIAAIAAEFMTRVAAYSLEGNRLTKAEMDRLGLAEIRFEVARRGSTWAAGFEQFIDRQREQAVKRGEADALALLALAGATVTAAAIGANVDASKIIKQRPIKRYTQRAVGTAVSRTDVKMAEAADRMNREIIADTTSAPTDVSATKIAAAALVAGSAAFAARSYTIMQTETNRAQKAAAMVINKAAADSGLVTGEWVWTTAGDDSVCPECESLDGSTFSMSEDFEPAHPNCRCAPLTVPEPGATLEDDTDEDDFI
jgi:hypothetical protein